MALISNNPERIVAHLAKSKSIVSFHKSLAKEVQNKWEKLYKGEIQWMLFGNNVHAMRTSKAVPINKS